MRVDRQHLAAFRVRLLQLLEPGVRQAEPARAGQRLQAQLDLERVQRPVGAQVVEHLDDQVDRHAEVGLAGLARRSRSRSWTTAPAPRRPRRPARRRTRSADSAAGSPSRLLSRNRMVRVSGSCSGSIVATCVARDLRSPSPSMPTTVTVWPSRSGCGLSSRGAHRRRADQLRVVGDHREVVQRMHELDAAGNLERAAEGQPHVAERHRHRVAIRDHQSALRIHQQAGAVVVAVGDAGDRERHVEGDVHQRRRELRDHRVAHRRQCRGAAPSAASAAGPAARSAQGHSPAGVVAMALARREPAAVHAHRLQLAAVRIVDRRVAHAGAVAIAERSERRAEIREVRDRLAVDAR